MKRIFIALIWIYLSGGSAQGQALSSDQDSSGYFTNPVGKGADPWVIKDGNSYYSIFSVNHPKDGNFITISSSPALSRIGLRKKVWTAPADAWNSKCLWAPELHRINNEWYIYYTAGKSGPPYIFQRSGVLESVGSDPQGEYRDMGLLKTGNDPDDQSKTIWAIDLTVTEINKALYAVWSGWEKNSDTDKTSQHLYLAKMTKFWVRGMPVLPPLPMGRNTGSFNIQTSLPNWDGTETSDYNSFSGINRAIRSSGNQFRQAKKLKNHQAKNKHIIL